MNHVLALQQLEAESMLEAGGGCSTQSTNCSNGNSHVSVAC